jgi:hypothetical protein
VIKYYDIEYYKPSHGANALEKQMLAFVDLVFLLEEFKARSNVFFHGLENTLKFMNHSKLKTAFTVSGIISILENNQLMRRLF